WPNRFVEETNIYHNICVLRKALGEAGRCIQTASGDGYRFVAEGRRVANSNLSQNEVERSEEAKGHGQTALGAVLENLGFEQRAGTESERIAMATAEIRVRPGGLTLEIEIPGLRAKEPATEGPERNDDQIDANSPGSRGRRRSAK